MISSRDRNLESQLQQLIQETCGHPRGSLERQRGLNQIVGLMQQSGKIWGGAGEFGADDYGDALQQTWLYFCRNLCEASTGNAYDSTQASPITWMNTYLKYRLQDMRQQTAEHNAVRWTPSAATDESSSDPIENLPSQPDPPPMLEEIRTWVQQDRQLRRIHVRDRPDITCQILILRRLPPETPWKTLADEFGVAIATLSHFYHRECFPRLLEFGKSQGYFDV